MFVTRILRQPGTSSFLKRALVRISESAEDLYTQFRSDFAPLPSLELFSFSPPEATTLSSQPPSLSATSSLSTSSPSISSTDVVQAAKDDVDTLQPDSHALSLLNRFQVTTDRVLGGMSTATLTAKRYKYFTSGVFSGLVDFVDQSGSAEATARGGFAAFRTKADERVRNFSAFDGLELRVKTDGRVYTLNIKCADYPADALWQCKIVTLPHRWVTIGIPFRDLVLTRRGRIEPEKTPVSSEAIAGVGVLLADGKNGPFKFEVQWARAVRKITEQEFVTVPEQLMAASVSSKALPLPTSTLLSSGSPSSTSTSTSKMSTDDEDSKRRERIRAHREALNDAKLEKPANL
jgi:hypothetical protein